MAALPENGLYPSMVANAIGLGTTNYGKLHVNDKVNRWGFNTPDAAQQAKVWGVENPEPWYEIGGFRRYDHYWRCFGLDNCEIGGDLNTYGPGFLGFWLKSFPNWSDAPGFQTVPHVFDVLMNRYDPIWDPVYGSVLIAQDWTFYEDTGDKIDIDPLDPPDGLGPLAQNSTIYFSFRHKSSPARRWDSRNYTQAAPIGGTGTIAKDPDGNYDGWTISIEIGQPL